mgnify:CR=1 FL=1
MLRGIQPSARADQEESGGHRLWHVKLNGFLSEILINSFFRRNSLIKNSQHTDGEIPWISAKTLTGDTVTTSNLFITEEGLHAGSKLAPVGSILLLTRGSGLFKRIPLAIVNAPVAYNQDVKCMTSKVTTITNEYVFLCIKGTVPRVNKYARDNRNRCG